MKILIIEDHPNLATDITSYLRAQDFVCEHAPSLRHAQEKLESYEYGCILLDLMLPDGSGAELLPFIRDWQPEAYVIVVSAKDSVDSKVELLDAGADDYMIKPFSLPELQSRIRAISRRKHHTAGSEVHFQEITLCLNAHTCAVAGKPVVLTPKEFGLLEFFISNSGRTLSKQSIAGHIWGDYTYHTDNVDFIYQHLKNLRKKLTAAGAGDYLQTVYGLGYKWSEG